MKEYTKLLKIFIAIISVYGFFYAPSAYAQSTFSCEKAPDIPSGATELPSRLAPGTPYDGWTSALILCLQDQIFVLVNGQINVIRDQIKNGIAAVLVLYIMLLSIRLALGNLPPSSARGELVASLFKVVGVTFFTLNVGINEFYPIFTGIQIALVETVVGAMPSVSSCGPLLSAWERVDCVVARVLGADVQNDIIGPVHEAAFKNGASPLKLLFMAVSGLFFWSYGIPLLVIAAFLIFMMILSVALAILAYLMAIMAVALLMVISPLIIPLFLFPFFRDVVQYWMRSVIAYTIQPLVLFTYLTFAMQVVGVVLDGPPGGHNILGLTRVLDQIDKSISGADKVERTVMNAQRRVERGGDDNPGDEILKKNKKAEAMAFLVPDLKFKRFEDTGSVCDDISDASGYNVCITGILVVNLLVAAIMFSLLAYFMGEVMRFGHQMAGLTEANFGKIVSSIYNRIMKVAVEAAKSAAGAG